MCGQNDNTLVKFQKKFAEVHHKLVSSVISPSPSPRRAPLSRPAPSPRPLFRTIVLQLFAP